ncbi:hypothetical protein [Arthrobacter sp. 260]|uniref:hypothetical protein n=1 Tax=Arthrobacter sp. 260 TaxID=2735314 RepID=UPI001491878C|nr:hypothetical protein [Arthrobacter sp. 260]NOJ60587.1 hypothetical protein [Arthrobacter sp. 260]
MISDRLTRRQLSRSSFLVGSGLVLLVLAGCGAESGGTAPGTATGSPTATTQSETPAPSGQPTPDPSDTATGNAAADAQLSIVLTAGEGAEPVTYELACEAGEPVGDSALPDPSAACDVLATNGDLIMDEPAAGAMCTQLYGGPETAVVTGTLNGNAVDASFSRDNGCSIDRWAMFEPLLGTSGGVQ